MTNTIMLVLFLFAVFYLVLAEIWIIAGKDEPKVARALLQGVLFAVLAIAIKLQVVTFPS